MQSINSDVIMAGFGGQGIILIGNLLAYAAMDSGLNATFMPVYGPEMRGGTSNCTVVISDQEIGSPIIKRPQTTIILNQPSFDKFQPKLLDGGLQVVNSSLVDVTQAEKNRVRTVSIPVNAIADEIGSARLVNMVALGAYLKATALLPLKVVQDSVHHVVAAHNSHLIPKNITALEAGYNAA